MASEFDARGVRAVKDEPAGKDEPPGRSTIPARGPAERPPAGQPPGPVTFTPSWESLNGYQPPEWFRDAKFGIFVHWGAMSVPEKSCWYGRQMYMTHGSYGGGEVYRHHLQQYGHPSQFGFKDLIPLWTAENFDPDELAALAATAGARYVVAVAVHHDNVDNFASTHQPWNSVNLGPKRDVIADWKAAIEGQGLRFGVSSHCDRAWQWFHSSHGSDSTGALAGVPYDGNLTLADGQGHWWEGYDPSDLYGRPHQGDPMASDESYMQVGEPPDEAFQRNWFLRTSELLDRYHPDLLYFDGPLPFGRHGLRLAAEFYNANQQRHDGRLDAVLNIKSWGPATVPDRSAVVLDVEKGGFDRTVPFAWQTDTSILPDWIYTPQEHALSDTVIIHNLCDIVSKNGNLLLNISPRADGSLPDDQRRTLSNLGDWLEMNGEAIYHTRPWRIFGEGTSRVRAGDFQENTAPMTARDLRYTCRPAPSDGSGAETLYAIVMDWPADGVVRIASITAAASIELVGTDATLSWRNSLSGVHVRLPAAPLGRFAHVLRIRGHRTLFAADNRLAWCIVPFDRRRRTPAERLDMLHRLGLTQYGWDWRHEHVPDLPGEIELAGAMGIRLRAVWLWIDAEHDAVGRLGHGNAAVVTAVDQAELPVEFWVGFHPNYFAGLDHSGRVHQGAEMLAYVRGLAAASGSTVALYNHGGWFGEPEHQLEIIDAVGDPYVGIVYNFHHAGVQADRFATLLPRMLPRLRAVNLTGVDPDGPQILPLGTGTQERSMIQALDEAGYTGPLGVLGHVENADVEMVLRRNLQGLAMIAEQLSAEDNRQVITAGHRTDDKDAPP